VVDDVADVMTASRVLVAVAARSLAGRTDEITLPQYRALVVMAGRGAVRPVDLADALSSTAPTVTRLCDRLVAKGLIVREHRGPDRRSVELRLTNAGRRLVREVTTARERDIRAILEALPADDRAEVARAMRRFGEAAGEISDRAWPGPWEL
jgi:DNA-binding MarR family transcriptional regulator